MAEDRLQGRPVGTNGSLRELVNADPGLFAAVHGACKYGFSRVFVCPALGVMCVSEAIAPEYLVLMGIVVVRVLERARLVQYSHSRTERC